MTILLKHVKKVEYRVDSEAYRIPMRVTAVRSYTASMELSTYSLCPRCLQTIEREYQVFCNHCGQALDWREYTKDSKGRDKNKA